MLEINRASGVNGAVEAEALDWTTAFVDGNGDPVEFEVVDLDGDAHVIGFDDEAFHLEATATFDAFGFVVGTVKVTVGQETVDADLDGEGTADLTGAQLLTIAIEINPAHTPDGNLFIGVNGVGFSLDSGTLFVATLKAKPAAPGATTPADPRTWTAIAANLTGAQLVGLPEDFVFVADTIQLKINQAAGGATPPDPLDWGAALDIDGDGVFGEDAEDDDPQDALIRGEGVDEVEIDFAGRILLVAGAVRIRIADFVYVAGQFALEKGDPILVTPVGSATQVEVTLLRVGVSEANVFVGMGVPDSNGDGIFDGTDDLGAVDSIGIALTDTSLAIALMRQTPATPGGTPGPLSFTALKVTSTATLLGVPAVSLSGTITVQVNTGKDAANPTARPAVDFTKLDGGALTILTGPDPAGPDPAPSIDLDYASRLLQAAGTVTLTISEFVFITADFAFRTSDEPVTVTTQDGLTGDVTVMTIGASNGYAFFGTGGPYWDTDGDGKVTDLDEPSADGAIGLAISDVSVALALLKPVVGAGAGDLAGYKAFTVLKARGTVQLIGVDDVTANLRNLQLELNTAALIPPVTPPPTPPPLPGALDLSDTPLTVVVGPPDDEGEEPTIELDYAGRLLRASASVELIFGGFVAVSGNFVFEQGEVLQDQALDNGETADLAVMKIGASDVYVFLGTGGPYWIDSDTDGDIDEDDEPAAAGAIGLALGGVDVAIALLKPTGAAPTRSFFAVKAHADSIALVGVDGVTLSGTDIDIEVNGGSDKSLTPAQIAAGVDRAGRRLQRGRGRQRAGHRQRRDGRHDRPRLRRAHAHGPRPRHARVRRLLARHHDHLHPAAAAERDEGHLHRADRHGLRGRRRGQPAVPGQRRRGLRRPDAAGHGGRADRAGDHDRDRRRLLLHRGPLGEDQQHEQEARRDVRDPRRGSRRRSRCPPARTCGSRPPTWRSR